MATEGTGRPSPRGRRGRAGDRERGSGTVVVVGAVGLLLALVVGALDVVAAVVASHRAQSAADLAALAVASVVVRGEAPDAACARAGRLVEQSGGRLVGCRTTGDLTADVLVQVTAAVPRVGTATARSRAGPAPGPSP